MYYFPPISLTIPGIPRFEPSSRTVADDCQAVLKNYLCGIGTSFIVVHNVCPIAAIHVDPAYFYACFLNATP